ncbi:MAG: M28 family peptidase, partial [Bryobacteraceae bacterium]
MRLLIVGILFIIPALAEQHVDLNVVNRIKAEAFDNSKVMDTLQYLTDVYGPRLTASPEFDQAADWAVKWLETYGLENVHKEKWGPFGRSWSIKEYSVEILAPRYAVLDAVPLAWTGGTNGPVSGDAMVAPFGTGERTYGKKLAAELDHFEKEYRGKLKGKIVLLTSPKDPAPESAPNFVRYSDAQLAALANAPEPRAKVPYDLANLVIPENAEERSRLFYSLPVSVVEAISKQRVDLLTKRDQFLGTEGVLAVLTRDNRAHGGLLFAEAASSHKADVPLAPPMFVVTAEQYNRIARLIGLKIHVQVRVDEKVEASGHDVDTANIVGEIPGGDKKDEVVMVGAHFDSWDSATGATDNGAGSAVMIEVMRILKALDLKMDRTVRIALWGGEEEGLFGSKAYVKEHF